MASDAQATPKPAVEGKEGGGESRARRNLLLEIQAQSQKKWEDSKIFEVNAPAAGEERPPAGKFFGNFPYPYMNGLLHLGHAFSLSKLEFASAYHRLCGKHVLFPQGFHCTGMPIKACADKLDREITLYGAPPRVPEQMDADAEPVTLDTSATTVAEEEAQVAASHAAALSAAADKDPAKYSGKKSKAAAKQGTAKTQWAILVQSGIPEEDIPQFRETAHWLRFFPPKAERDIRAMGCSVDWRRSFITTDLNPYYDSFTQWQFWSLKSRGKVIKDKRYAVWSPLDGQPCADHDRASGEGVGPQEYTLIKMKALELKGKLAALEGQGPVYLLAATLRPETMFGQTNCWVLPEGQYGAYRGLLGEIYVMTQRSAFNLSFQERTPQRGEPELLLSLTGQDLIGVPLTAPNCPHDRIYVLPLLTILTNKGTGIVTSVPSDSPDDYMALLDLKKKPKLREKYFVEDSWVLPFEVIPIIDIPGFGTTAAQKVCEDLKIQSQNDAVKLAEAKGQVYLKGFTEGVMVVGPHAGRKVSEVKPVIKEELIASGDAMLYSEPEKTVVSRSGDECVVALTDQWYIVYGEEEWQALTRQALEQMETYHDETRHQFEHCLGWLQQWACSRSFGLGTRLPWDPQYLIESLSDSTVYMAYYTVAHLLQGGDMYGESRSTGVDPQLLTNEVWDYIYLGKDFPASTPIPKELLEKCRAEFEYWYPFDLRVSGKDLIQNHLSFALYTHTALWPEGGKGSATGQRWPQSYRCNGHLLLNADKMSKSTGNFLTLHQAIDEFSADAMRWALADAGDLMDDANFETMTANAAILRLTKELTWIDEMLAGQGEMRDSEPTSYFDRVFDNEMNILVDATRAAFDRMMFREALKHAAYDLSSARDAYRLGCNGDLNRRLILRYIELSTLLLAPFTPHTSEHIWSDKLGKAGSVLNAGWPKGTGAPDFVLQRSAAYLNDQLLALRTSIKKMEAPPKKKPVNAGPPPKVVGVELFVAERFIGWQEKALVALSEKYDSKVREFAADALEHVMAVASTDPSLAGQSDKALKQTVMPFAKRKMEDARTVGQQVLDVKLPFDECSVLTENADYLKRSVPIDSLVVHLATDAVATAAAPQKLDFSTATPGTPIAAWAVQSS